MRKVLDLHLDNHSIQTRTVEGLDAARAGRWLIAKTLLDLGAATADPLGPANPLLFSAGPFAGTTFSNANRTSVGCRSPLTGGIKEANAGGTFGYGMGQLGIATLTLHGASKDWVVIHLRKDGGIDFDDATPYLGKGNFAAAEALFAKYGRKVALALCGPVGEYQGLLAGIGISDIDGRPSRMAARGGVGAVMGAKKVKAIVADLDKVPQFHDAKGVRDAAKDYAQKLNVDDVVLKFYRAVGTMGMADFQNYIGGMPNNNFRSGQQTDAAKGQVFQMGGDFIGPLNTSRGGDQTHACMPGCVIQCSNVYFNAEGKEVASPIEYETLGLLGTNCGLSHPDHLAALNYLANDLGVDSIELGAMIGVLMEAGLGAFGDVDFMTRVLAELGAGTPNGRLWAEGTARVGERYGIKRVPVIKKQAISAYDPRVVEVTGLSMMATAQGADHTVGNLPRLKSRAMPIEELLPLSREDQIKTATSDSLGLCIFGRTVTTANMEFIMNAVNASCGTSLTKEDFHKIGRETLAMEHEFNRRAGFTSADDELPAFFYDEPLPPTGQTARFHGADVKTMFDGLSMP
ncbi:MAG: hypothetical protein K1X39_05125 [Thermoflexales bacterium]|nr:hypothetical protein [Thermoflexales bacterium]